MKYINSSKRILSLFLLWVLCLQNVVFADARSDSMDAVLQYQRVNYTVPGMVVTVVKDGEVLYENVSGDANIDALISLDATKTAIQTGSVAKLITTIALLDLMSEHEISPEAKISAYLIDQYVLDDALTFRDLLQHTTGIPTLKFDTALETSPFSKELQFAHYADLFMTSYKHRSVMPSGQYTIYSDVGMVIAGLLIEALSNEPYEQYVSDAVLTPRNMTQSASFMVISDTNDLADITLATGYHVFGGDQIPQPSFQTKLIASEDFVTTISDMTKLMKSLTTLDKSENLYQQMFTRQVSVYKNILGRSMGLTIKRDHGNDIYLQDGGVPGETARVFFDPAENMGVFIWYNSDSTTLRDELTEAILDLYIDSSSDQISGLTANDSDADVNDFIGAYSPINVSSETIERVTKILHQIRVSDSGNQVMIDNEVYHYIGDELYYSDSVDQYARFIVDDTVKKTYLVIDNTFYEKIGLFKSMYFQLPILFLTALLNVIALLYILIKWQTLLLNRIHSTPRITLLSETLSSMVCVVIIAISGMRYSAWAVAYNTSFTSIWLKIFGIITGLLIIPSFVMLSRAKTDFRWRGSTIIMFRMLLILNGLMVIWLLYYKFI